MADERGIAVASFTRSATRPLDAAALVPGLTAFTAVVAAGFASGGYFPSAWGWAALAFALLTLLGVLAGDRVELEVREWAAVTLLAALGVWTLVSVLWSPSAAQPVLAFERIAVYVLALLAVLLVCRPGTSAGLLAGVLAGTVLVSGYGLLTYRGAGRLAGPVGYANGAGILAVLGMLVALGLAANVPSRAGRAVSFGAVPLLAATVHLTFSRGSWLALAAGLCVALLVDVRRMRLLAVLLLACAAPALAVWLAGVEATGDRLGVAVVAATVIALAIGWELPKLQRAGMGTRGRRLAGAAVLFVVAAAVLGTLAIAGGPGRIARPLPSGGDLDGRLLSASSDGRSAYWRVAWDEARAHPVLGGGAGSFAGNWLLLRSTDLQTQNAHNLYLETLAELGPVGLALLLAVFAVPLGAVRRARGHPAATAGSAAFAAFAVHAAVDWDFQLVAVTLGALFCAAAVLVSARSAHEGTMRSRGRWIGGAVLAAAAALAIVAQIGNSALAGSRSALDRDDPARAAQLARRAERWQPWSFEPLEALGEAQLAGGNVGGARVSFRRALALDRPNATLWLELADASAGAARSQALAAARRLDPRGLGGTPG